MCQGSQIFQIFLKYAMSDSCVLCDLPIDFILLNYIKAVNVIVQCAYSIT